MINNNKEQENGTASYVAALAGIILIFGVTAFSYIYPHFQRKEFSARVVQAASRDTDYQRINGFVVELEDGKRMHLDNSNSLLEMKIDAGNIQERIEPGKIYNFEVYGLQTLNIVRVEEIDDKKSL